MKSLFSNGTLLFLLFLNGCVPSSSESDANEENRNAAALRDSLENEMVETMDEINYNLDLIRQKQGLISEAGGTEDLNKKSEILRNISLINSLLEANRKKIEELINGANRLGREKNTLARIAKQTAERIKKQEDEIIQLKQQLAMEEFKVADLYNKMDEVQVENEIIIAEKSALEEINAQLDKDLNKVFFTYGTRKELETKGIVEKKGGLLGIGQKNTLANAFFKNREYFTELDIRQIKAIPIRGKKPSLLTLHPTGSYEWKDVGNEYAQLYIHNSQEFWATSRFLIIQVQ